MKKTLLTILGLAAVSLAGVNAQTLLFTQNFTSSATVADYASGSPSIGQWNAISTANATLKSWAINSNSLQITSSGGSTAAATRTTDFSPIPTALNLSMTFNLVSSSSANTQALQFSFGNGYTTANGDASTTLINTRFSIGTTNSNQWFIRDVGGSASSGNFTGSQTINLFTNSSGGSISYNAPNGSSPTLANGKWDIWVGTTAVFTDRNTNNSTLSLTDFKISNPGSGNYVAQMTDFAITEVVPEPSTWALIGLGTAFVLWRIRRKKSLRS